MTCSGEILNVEVINKTVFLNFIIKIFLNKDKIEIFIMFIKNNNNNNNNNSFNNDNNNISKPRS